MKASSILKATVMKTDRRSFMKKIKEFFDKLLYESPDDDDEEKVTEVKPEPVVKKVQPQPKKVEEVRKEPVRKEPEVVEVIKEERKTPSFITLPKTEETEEPVVEEVITETEPVATQEEKPAEEPAKEPVREMTEEEKRRELDYRTSTVISPMFGVQEKKEEKPGRRQSKKPAEPEKIPDLADIQSSSKSVLGTVFSPLYGDKDASDNIPHDDIDPAVADLSVEDFIEEKKVEKPAEKVTEIVEEPVREKLADRPDLIVSPFGVKENPNREKLNDDQYYENISLFDLEDK